MKKYSFILLIAAFFCSCNNTNLFSPNNDEKVQQNLDGPSGQTIIEMQITGGLAGVNQELLIDANRFVQFNDRRFPSGQIETVLTTEELNRLLKVFVEKDFVHLKPQYIDPNVADAFNYRVIYRYSGANKQVDTDYFGAPAELRVIVEQLLNLTKPLGGLTLEFKTSAEQLRHGEKLALTLTVANRSAAPITLAYSSGQRYDFFAAAVGNSATYRISAQSQLWNWANDKAFIAVLMDETLQSGESRKFTAEWDGRNNRGELLEGEFALGARLVSQPGGYSATQRIVITK